MASDAMIEPGDYAELVERLGSVVPISKPHHEDNDVEAWNWLVRQCHEAASAIQSLTAKIADLKRHLPADEMAREFAAVAAELSRLECLSSDEWREHAIAAEAEVSRLRTRGENLEGALRPLAIKANAYDGIPKPKYFGDTNFETHYRSDDKAAVTVADLRRARSALLSSETNNG